MWENSGFCNSINIPSRRNIFGPHIACQPDSCHLNLTSFSRSTITDVVKYKFRNYASLAITIQSEITIYGTQIYNGEYMLCRCVSADSGLTLLTLFNLRHIFMFRSVSLLPYSLASSYLFFSLIIEDKCQPDTGHLILVSLSRSTYFFLNLCQDFVIRSLLLLQCS